MINDDTPCVAAATTDALLEKTVSNAKEVSARGARLLFVTRKSLKPREKFYRDLLLLTYKEEFVMPILAIVPPCSITPTAPRSNAATTLTTPSISQKA